MSDFKTFFDDSLTAGRLILPDKKYKTSDWYRGVIEPSDGAERPTITYDAKEARINLAHMLKNGQDQGYDSENVGVIIETSKRKPE